MLKMIAGMWWLGVLVLLHSAAGAKPGFTDGTPSVSRVTAKSLHINVHLDTQGRYFWIITHADVPQPSAAQVKQGVDAQGQAPLARGGQQVTTTTLTYTDIVFQGLNYSTPYAVFVVAEDQSVPPLEQDEATRLPFRTLEGRKTFMLQEVAEGSQANRLGLGDVLDRHTPTAVPQFSGLQVTATSPFTVFNLPDGKTFRVGDLWNSRMTWSTENVHFDPTLSQAQMSTGGAHWLGVVRQKLLATGSNQFGQLGCGDLESRTTASSVQGFDRVQQVSAGMQFSMILQDSSVYTMGRNQFGQLGTGDTADRWTPTLVPQHTGIHQISAGRDHAMFVKDRTAFAFGSNRFGQLGLGDTIERHTPTAIPGFTNVSAAVAANYFSFLIQDGQMYSFGYNYQTSGVFKGYSPQNVKCYEQHSSGCFDVGKPSANMDDPSRPFNADN